MAAGSGEVQRLVQGLARPAGACRPLRAAAQELHRSGVWTPANSRAAVLVEDTDFGRGWGEAAIKSLGEAGARSMPYDVTALDETEFGPLLLKYRAQQVSLVGMTSTGNVASPTSSSSSASSRSRRC